MMVNLESKLDELENLVVASMRRFKDNQQQFQEIFHNNLEQKASEYTNVIDSIIDEAKGDVIDQVNEDLQAQQDNFQSNFKSYLNSLLTQNFEVFINKVVKRVSLQKQGTTTEQLTSSNCKPKLVLNFLPNKRMQDEKLNASNKSVETLSSHSQGTTTEELSLSSFEPEPENLDLVNLLPNEITQDERLNASNQVVETLSSQSQGTTTEELSLSSFEPEPDNLDLTDLLPNEIRHHEKLNALQLALVQKIVHENFEMTPETLAVKTLIEGRKRKLWGEEFNILDCNSESFLDYMHKKIKNIKQRHSDHA